MPRSLRDPSLPLVGLAFFLSGAAALAYQVAWQRILALQTGVGLHSIAVIVAAFMLGLGLGSHLGGSASMRSSASRSLLYFALCELGIAAYGAASVPLLYDWLYARAAWLYSEPIRGALLQFGTLAVPTVLMGMSLPFLARAMVHEASSAGGTIAFLYGINVLGAAAGALATPWVFIRHHGIRAAVWAAVVANLVAGVSALALALWRRRRSANAERAAPATGAAAATATSPATSPATATSGHSFRSWIALYALSGFCALSLEILWFRVMEVSVKSTAYTFGTLLAVYLLGSGVGSVAGITLARRLRAHRRAFLVCQCVLLAYAALTLGLLVWIPPSTPGYEWFYGLWGGKHSFNLGGATHWSPLLKMYVLMPLALFGPPTVLMGLSYPILQRAVQDDPARSGWKVGMLQAANIAGCVAGSLFVGLVTLSWLGTTGTFRLLAVIGLVFAAMGMREPGGRRLFAGFAFVLVALAIALPGQRALWLRLHGTQDEKTLLEEDATGIVALIPSANRWKVWAGGRWHSMLPFGGMHTTLGAAPAVVHPAPREVAIIGLGSGDTAASAGLRQDIDQQVTVFELYAPEHRLLSALMDTPDPPVKLGWMLDDPRFTFRVADGRNALEREGRRYDIIEADALWPTSPYAGNLYSVEFFRLCARRLKPGGIATTWAPTDRVRASFLSVFPHAIEMSNGQLLMGSDSPIPIDPPAWRERLFVKENVTYLGRPRANGVWVELREATPAARAPVSEGDINRDLFPRDEFHTPD
ncbi:MAG TPA: spermidine synthase [Vicinamibacteria bacterium]|nr:spermidine synthase [Vicinamibacteria bacterium]